MGDNQTLARRRRLILIFGLAVAILALVVSWRGREEGAAPGAPDVAPRVRNDNAAQDFLEACRDRDYARAEALITQFPEDCTFNRGDEHCRSPLMYLAADPTVTDTQLRRLMDASREDIFLDFKDDSGWTAADHARATGNPEVAAFLAEAETQFHRRMETPSRFLAAIKARDYPGATAVLKAEPTFRDLNYRDDEGKTALMYAAGDTAITATDIKELIHLGGDPKLADHSGRTAADYARAAGNQSALTVLTVVGDQSNRLLAAARAGDLPEVRALLDAGVDPNTVDQERCISVLGCAAQQGNRAVAALLLERGAKLDWVGGSNITAATELEGDPDAAFVACDAGHPELARWLVEQQLATAPDYLRHSQTGYLMMITAIRTNDAELARFLVGNGYRLMSGPMPLIEGELALAAQGGNREICDLLVRADEYAFRTLIERKQYETAARLLELGVAVGDEDRKALVALVTPANSPLPPEQLQRLHSSAPLAAALRERAAQERERVAKEQEELRTPAGLTAALFEAIRKGDAEQVDHLLFQGAQLNRNRHEGKSPLGWAISCRHYTLAIRLLERGADPNELTGVDDRGTTPPHPRTPLMLAVGRAFYVEEVPAVIPLMEKLIARGARVNEAPQGETALDLAWNHPDPRAAGILLAHGATGERALQAAVRTGDAGLVARVLRGSRQAASDLNVIAMVAAAEQGNLAMVREFLAAGFPVDAREEMTGRTALQAATENGHSELVRFLVEQGAAINPPNDPGGRATHGEGRIYWEVIGSVTRQTPLAAAAGSGNRPVVDYLLARGADPNGTNDIGVTPLMVAASNGRAEMVTLLLDRGAAVDQQTMNGNTALSGLMPQFPGQANLMPPGTAPRAEIIRILRRAGANADLVSEDGLALLHLAVLSGDPGVVAAFLEGPLEVDVRVRKDAFNLIGIVGATPLMLAAQRGQLEDVRALVEAGASLSATDAAGRTALDYASLPIKAHEESTAPTTAIVETYRGTPEVVDYLASRTGILTRVWSFLTGLPGRGWRLVIGGWNWIADVKWLPLPEIILTITGLLLAFAGFRLLRPVRPGKRQ